MYDIKIIGGTIVDGTGKPRFQGDVGIIGDRIAAVGDVPGDARRVIDATGCIVTPGFVDIHTHYDGQVSWDEELAPSSIHGVTTAVMGSCGVGFAPVRPTDHAKLVELMEGVEDIPGSALSEGISWGWESFPEYMATLDAMPHSIDFMCLVPHDALRVYVMGERCGADQQATPEDIAAMRRIVREAVEAGAAGFSTGRSDNHRSAKGEWTPSSEAAAEELAGIAAAFQGLGHGVLQAVSDFDILRGDVHFDREFKLLEGMVRSGGGRPMSISTMQRDHSKDQWKWILERAEKLVAEGFNVRCQVAPRGIGVILGLEATFHPFMGFPSYKRISHLPLAERVARMREPGFKAQLLSEKSEPVAGDGSMLPPLADFFLQNLNLIVFRLFRLGERPNYEPTLMESLGFEAKQKDIPVMSLIFDAMIENDGKSLIYFPVYNYTEGNLDNVHAMLTHPLAIPGLSDGGAHVGTICDASFSTFLLTHWARDRQKGQIPLERVVQLQTSETAAYIGLPDRGVLAPGLKADLNVIDFDNLRLHPPAIRHDLPAGGGRLIQLAEGYRATVVSGQVIVEDGVLTDARPGRLVRAGQVKALVEQV